MVKCGKLGAMIERLELRIRGHVQGVYYRASTRETANKLGLQGWVRNCPDGSVELLAEGPRARLQELLEWCASGPPAARVDTCEARWGEASGEFQGFSIQR